MTPKTLADYGGPFNDEDVVQNPETEQSAALANREFLDTAQLTQCSQKAGVFFATSAAAPATYSASDVAHKSQWGAGSATKPTVAKTATGRYTITYASTQTDELDEVETLALRPIAVHAMSSNAGDNLQARFVTVSGGVATLVVCSPPGTPADVGDVSAAAISIAAWMG